MQEGEKQAREGAGRGEAGECGSDERSRTWEEQSREGQARGRVEAGGGKVRTGIGKGVDGVGGGEVWNLGFKAVRLKRIFMVGWEGD